MLAEELKDDFGFFGVKETGVDDMGTVEFQQQYYPFPLYCDKSHEFYRALGDRKVGMMFDPTTLFSFLCEAWNRLRSKKIGGNLKGEGITQGGIIFLNAKGRPVYAYEEKTGQDIPIKDIMAVVERMRTDAS